MFCLPILFEIANYFIMVLNLMATEINILLEYYRRNNFAIYAPSIYSALPLSLKCQNTSPSEMDFLCIIHAHQ